MINLTFPGTIITFHKVGCSNMCIGRLNNRLVCFISIDNKIQLHKENVRLVVGIRKIQFLLIFKNQQMIINEI